MSSAYCPLFLSDIIDFRGFELLSFLVAPYLLLTSVLHLTFAVAVWRDGAQCKSVLHRGPFLVPYFVWGLVALVGGLPAVGVYWLIHHSSLRVTNPLKPELPSPVAESFPSQ